MWVFKKEIYNNIDMILEEAEERFGYPCFVKPSKSGSSIGIYKAHNRDELISALESAAAYDYKVIIEEFIDARELECSVLGNDTVIASSVGEIVPSSEFYDYDAKYYGDSKLFIPADIDKEVSEEIRSLSVQAFKAIDAKGMSRVDFFLEKQTGKIYVGEINTIPGFTNISMYPKLFENNGIGYSELIDRLIELALEN